MGIISDTIQRFFGFGKIFGLFGLFNGMTFSAALAYFIMSISEHDNGID